MTDTDWHTRLDVLGGIALGLAWLCVSVIVFGRRGILGIPSSRGIDATDSSQSR